MAGVGEISPGQVLESVPLTQEVVAAVVPDLGDVRVHDRQLRYVRGVDDDLAAVSHDRFQLVEALGCGPDVLILARHHCQHTRYGCVQVRDVSLRGDVCGGCPGLLRRAERHGVQGVCSGLHHQAQGPPLGRNHRCSLVDQRPHRRHPAGADDRRTADEGADPVRDVDHLLPGDTGKEVLVAAAEADHLVREDGADHDRQFCLGNEPVDPHLDAAIGEQSVGQFGDAAGRDGAEGGERLRAPELVVADVPAGITPTEEGREVLVAHRLVGSQRDDHGHGCLA